MRTLENTYIPKTVDASKTVIQDILSIEKNSAFLSNRLLALQQTMASVKDNAALQALYIERQSVESLISNLKSYIQSLESKKRLGIFLSGQLSATDVTLLHQKAASLEKMRALIESPTEPTDKLSQLIDEADKLNYAIPSWKKWLRRGALILGGLASAALTIGVLTVLMTPGMNVGVIGGAIVTSLVAAAAFWKLHSPVMTNTVANTYTTGTMSSAYGTMNYTANSTTTVAIPTPSTVGVAAAGVFGAAQFFKRAEITSPKKERAAENVTISYLNQLIVALKKQVAAMPDHDRSTVHPLAKQLLMNAVSEAASMLNSGANGWFYETRDSKIQKARLIMREIAKMVEHSETTVLTVGTILNWRINNSAYTFGDLLNSQRNHSTFWKKESATAKALGAYFKMIHQEQHSVSFDKIAAVIGR